MKSVDELYAPTSRHVSGAPDWPPIRKLWAELGKADSFDASPCEADACFEQFLHGFDQLRRAVPEDHEQFAEKLKAAACLGLFGLIRQTILMGWSPAPLENEWLDLTGRPARAYLGCMSGYMLVPWEQQMYGFGGQGRQRVRFLWGRAGSPWITSLYRDAVALRWV